MPKVKKVVKKTEDKKVPKKKATKKEAAPVGINKVIADINAKFGVNALMFGKDVIPYAQEKIPSASISLDIAMGGGIPIGRSIQLSGMESCYKSTHSYHIIANAQKMGMKCALLQSETGSYTAEYGEYLGIDNEELFFSPSGGMEETFEIAHQLQKNGIVGLIVIDSIESLTPMKEYTSSMDDTVQMGIKPKMIGEYLRKFSATNNILLREGKKPCTLILINQLREKIGSYSDPLYTPGGNALKFYPSVDVRFRKGDSIATGSGNNKVIIGQNMKFKVNKNKVDVPLRTGSFDMYSDDGGAAPKGFVDNFKEIVLEGIMFGVVEKSGSWLSYEDVKVQGVEGFIEELRDNKKLYDKLYKELMESIHDDDDDVYIEEE